MESNQELIKRIEKLEQNLLDLNSEVYSNNFSAHQDFNKTCYFNTRLKVPHYTSTPSTGEVGELIEVSGKLYVCSATNVFTIVGTQT